MTRFPPERLKGRVCLPVLAGFQTGDNSQHPHAGILVFWSLLALGLAITFLGVPDGAEAQRLNIRHYTQADGLPQIQVYDVHQDRRGYIWIGTNAGLSRYDGRRFHSVTADDGLISNTVVVIDEFPSGTIVAAVDPGICFLDGDDISCLGYEDGIPAGQGRDLLLESNGDTWLASDEGITLVPGDGGEVRTFGTEDGLPDPMTLALLRGEDGVLWAGTRQGLVRFDGLAWKEVPIAGTTGLQVADLDLKNGRFLVGTSIGIYEKSGDRFLPIPFGGEPHSVLILAQEAGGTIWAETPEGLFEINGEDATQYRSEHGIPDYGMWELLVDREGNLWMGTNNGLSKLVPSAFSFFSVAEGLPNPFVRAMLQTSDGRLWFGTREGLAVRERGKIREVPFKDFVPDPRIFALSEAPEGGLLVGTAGGLVHLAESGSVRVFTQTSGLPHDYVYSLLPDSEGDIWIGTARGIVLWSGGQLRPPLQTELRTARALSLLRDDRGRLWVGLTTGGLLVAEGDSVRAVGPGDGMSDQAIWDLALGSDGNVWAGSNGQGVYRLHDDGIRRYTIEDGLADNFGWQVHVDRRGDAWIFTGQGLNRLSEDRVVYYGVAEGLQDLEGSASAVLETPEGEIWFGVGTGVYRYQPTLDVDPPPPSEVFLEAVTVGDQELPDTTRTFPPSPGVITFTFSTPSYRNEDGIRFRYRLSGNGSGWSTPSSEPQVSLAGLTKGDYVLEVEAVTARGQTTSTIHPVPFTVQAAFYQTLWFRGGVALVLLLGLAQIPVLRARHHEAERKRLESLVRERTQEIRQYTRRLEEEIQERKEAERARESLESQLRQAQKMEAIGRLAGGIAHDFNNLLTSVLGYSELLAADAGPDSELRQDLEEIRRSAEKGAALVAQLLAFSRQQVVELKTVDVGQAVQDTMGMVGRVIGEQVRLELELPDAPLWVRGDPNQLSQVILNLAVNARDAMPQGGKLQIGVAPRTLDEAESSPFSDPVPPGQYACILISDSGEGMDESTLRKAFEPFFTTKEVGKGSGLGLASVYGIVHQHQGFIQVSSAPGEGALFEIFLPQVEEA